MKNSLKKMEFLLAVQGLRLLPKKEKKNTLLRAPKEGINPVWLGWKERACNRSKACFT